MMFKIYSIKKEEIREMRTYSKSKKKVVFKIKPY